MTVTYVETTWKIRDLLENNAKNNLEFGSTSR